MSPLSYESLPPLSSENPLVSVIMFCRNRVKLVRKAIDSILHQTYQNWELVVQDGASTDGTVEAIQSYQDPRIKLVSAPDNSQMEAMWRVLKRCQGEVVASCLSDEELLPNALAIGVRYLLCNPEAAAMFGDVYFTNMEGKIIGRQNCTEFSYFNYLGLGGVLTLEAIIFRSQAIQEVGLHHREWRTDCGDFELMTLLGERFRVDYLPGIVGRYCQMSDDQLSTTPTHSFRNGVGALKFIFDRLGGDSDRNLIAHIPMELLRDCLHKLYVRHQDLEFIQKLQEEYSTLSMTVAPNSRDKARQALQIGKTNTAFLMLNDVPLQPENQASILQMQAEIADTYWMPEERSRLWGKLSELQMPHAEERFLAALQSLNTVKPWEILGHQKKWAASVIKPPDLIPFKADRTGQNSRVRLAFHAADWTTPQARFQLLPLISRLGESRFDLTCYVSEGTDLSIFPPNAKLSNLPASLNDVSFAEQVRQDKLDIFIETSGLQPGHRWRAIAARIAPIQISYLGHMATLGLRQVDYRIVDPFICPDASEKFYVEKLLRLPRTYTCHHFPPDIGRAWGKLNERITFACFAPCHHMNLEQIDTWSQLLKLCPGSVLLLANADFINIDSRLTLRAAFDSHQVSHESLRIIPRPRNEISAHLLAQADIYLDTFPQSHAWGVARALQYGIPTVSQAGGTEFSRLGGALLFQVGFRNLVTNTASGYVNMAAQLAGTPDLLRGCRDHLIETKKSGHLAELEAFAREFGDAILNISKCYE